MVFRLIEGRRRPDPWPRRRRSAGGALFLLSRDARLFREVTLAGLSAASPGLARRLWRSAHFRANDERRDARAGLCPCQRAALSDGNPAPRWSRADRGGGRPRPSRCRPIIRTLGFYRLAEALCRAFAGGAGAAQAYAGGVNAFLETHADALPPEFLLLGDKPEPWKPADSLVWGKLMALQLSHNYKLEALRAQLAQKLAADEVGWSFRAAVRGGPSPPSRSSTRATRRARARRQVGALLPASARRFQRMGRLGRAHGDRQADPRQRSTS